MNPNLQIKNKTNLGQNQINPDSIYYIQIIIKKILINTIMSIHKYHI